MSSFRREFDVRGDSRGPGGRDGGCAVDAVPIEKCRVSERRRPRFGAAGAGCTVRAQTVRAGAIREDTVATESIRARTGF